ncbi:MAG: NAD(+)/NADH kinase [Planctomycetes bacterium]|nr:NAD(+)/NADH kinase [Planctomycetota bacterium]
MSSSKNGGPHRVKLSASRKPRVLILGDPAKKESLALAKQIEGHLEGRVQLLPRDLKRSWKPIETKPDFVVTLGGDGAMLATSYRLGKRQVPVMGVNIGRIGFLAAFSPADCLRALDQVLEGDGRLEAHAMMKATVSRGRKTVLETHLLNEAVVLREWGASMLEVDLTVDRRPVCTYRGDGLIVSTATGSTAYSLSAGGPVLSPRLDAWVVTPIAPHTLNQRPVVLPGNLTARLKLQDDCGFTADGHLEKPLKAGDLLTVGPSPRRFHLIVGKEQHFFARLRSKLHWGEAPGPG